MPVITASAEGAVRHRATLTCHPGTPCAAVRGIEVRLLAAPGGALELRYTLDGDIDRLLIPSPGDPQRGDGLWQHTCLEAFLAGERTEYFEYNFAPSRQWALYRFAAYREGMAPVEPARAPRIAIEAAPRHLRLDVQIDPPLPAHRIALAAVVEDTERRLSYWALAHAAGKPDFHHPAAFALRLDWA
jgi:hypothetical protein